jgi:DNA-binding NarL/FixJ family response regulator
MLNKPTRILLIEDNAADANFLREALTELSELPLGQQLITPFEICEVCSIEEGYAVLGEIHFDIVLAGLWVADSAGINSFRLLRSLAPTTPFLLLVSQEDPQLTVRLLQEGAQDVMLKAELDCLPLGRAIRAAMERQRIAAGLRQLATRDELTGLLNPAGMMQVGTRVAGLLAERREAAACAWITVRIAGGSMGATKLQDLDWALVEFSELIRKFLGASDVACHFGDGRFLVMKPRQADEALAKILAELFEDMRVKATLRLGAPRIEFEYRLTRLDARADWDLEKALERMENSLWKPLRPTLQPSRPMEPELSLVH